MQPVLTHHTATRKSLEVVVPAAEVSEEFGKVIANIAPKVRIPGFRPGKAPRNVLMGRFQKEILQEVVESLVQRHFWAAAANAGTQPISQPAVERAELKEGLDGRLRVHFDVAPEVKLGDYKGITVVKKKRRIDDAAVEEHLEGLRQQAAKFLPVEEAAAEGHYATLDIKIKPQAMKAKEYKDQVVQLDASRPFDREILGMEVDQDRKFTVNTSEDDPNRFMAGKKIAYEVVLKDLRKREVPELNDDFAKDMGNYENLQALRDFLRKDLEEAAERDGLNRVQASILDSMLDNVSFEAPSSMVALQLDDYCNEFANMIARQGVDPRKINWSAYRQSRMRDAERAVRSGYLLQAIGNQEDIQVSDEEIDVEIRNFMEEHKIQQPFESFKAEMERRGATTEIKGRIRTDKIFDRLVASATITEELMDKAEFEALVELERRREAGIPAARFDAGGLEGGDLEDQEGGDPDAVKSAEESVEATESVEEETESKEVKPKKAAKKKDEESEEEAKPKKAAKKTEEGGEEKAKKSSKK